MATQVTDVPKQGHLPQGPFKCPFNPRGMSPDGCQHLTGVRVKNVEGCCATRCDSPYRACVACLLTGSEPAPVESNDTGNCHFHETHPPSMRRPRRSFDLSVEDLDIEWRRAIAERSKTATTVELPQRATSAYHSSSSEAHPPGTMQVYDPETKTAAWVAPLDALDIALTVWRPGMQVLELSEELHITPNRAYSLLSLRNLAPDVAKQLRGAKRTHSITVIHALSRLNWEVQRRVLPSVLTGTLDNEGLIELRRNPKNRISES